MIQKSELKTKKQDRTIKESELKTNRHNRPIQKSELKTKKQDRTIKESELKTNRHNRPIQKSELKTKKQDRTIKESELKTNRYNRPIQKSELGINRLHRPIQSEDRIGIGRSINRTFRPPLRICCKNMPWTDRLCFVKFGEPVRAKSTIQVLHIFESFEAIWKTLKVTFMCFCDGRENDPNVVFFVNFFEDDDKPAISKKENFLSRCFY